MSVLAALAFHLASRTTPALARLGLKGDALALWSRGRRCRRAWAPHEAATRAFVADALEGLSSHRTALVLGSGLLRDVPLGLIAARFARVVLVDAVHLPPARLAARRHRNVVFDTRDLSGFAGLAQGRLAERVPPLDDLLALGDVDFVVSVNLLSQMPLAIERHLDRRGENETAIAAVLEAVVRGHLADLAALPCRACLVTDVEGRVVAADKTVRERYDLMRGAPLPPPDASWDWTLAPAGEEEPDAAIVHRVHAWRDVRRFVALSP